MLYSILKNYEYCSCRRQTTIALIVIGGKYYFCSRCTFVLLVSLLYSIVWAVVAHTVLPRLTKFKQFKSFTSGLIDWCLGLRVNRSTTIEYF